MLALVESEMGLEPVPVSVPVQVLELELVDLAASLVRLVPTMAANSEPTVVVCNSFLVALAASAI